MRSLKQTLQAQRTTRLSRKTGCNPAAVKAAVELGLSADELLAVAAAARRDDVDTALAVRSYAARRGAAVSAVADGGLALDLSGQGAADACGASVSIGAPTEPPALDLGYCEAVVSEAIRPGESAVVMLRPAGPVELGPAGVARAASGAAIEFRLEPKSLAAQLVREGRCRLQVDPAWLADQAVRVPLEDR